MDERVPHGPYGVFSYDNKLGIGGGGQVGIPATRYDILTSHRPGRTGGITRVNDPAADAESWAYFLDRDEATGGRLVGKSHRIETDDKILLLEVLGLHPNASEQEIRVAMALYETIRKTGATVRTEVERVIKVTGHKNPEDVRWGEHGITTVIESSGQFNSLEGASRHLGSNGAKNVLVTAPVEDPKLDEAMLLYRINHEQFDPAKNPIVVSGSCTWKALAATLKVLTKLGLRSGTAFTVHSLTQGDQVALTRPRRTKLERGRAGGFAIVPTSTGSSEAVARLFPELKGKFNIDASRVPIDEGALIYFSVNFNEPQTVQEINDAFRRAAREELQGIVDVDDMPMTSADVVGVPTRAILQSNMTKILPAEPTAASLITWYANRFEAAAEAVDMAEYMAWRTNTPQ